MTCAILSSDYGVPLNQIYSALIKELRTADIFERHFAQF